MKAWNIASGLCLLALSVAARSQAQSAPARATVVETPPAPAAASAAAAPRSPLALSVQLNHAALDPEAIRKAIELELNRPVILRNDAPENAPTLAVIANPNHTVTVSYRTANGLIRTRTIGLPQDHARSAEVIALLSGNLSRDEAAELLAALTPQPAAAPAPAPVPAAPASNSAAASPAASPTASPAANESGHGHEYGIELAARKLPRLLFAPLNLSLASPLALYPDSPRRLLNAELGLAYGHVGELHGFGLNVLALHTERDVRGVTFATIDNRTDGTVTGLASAAVVNRNQQLVGAEIGGVLNFGSGQVQGVSVAGAANWHRDVLGLQAAGAFNRARRVEGLQLSGALNIAESVRGLQLGVVNVAGEVHGAQIGVLNIAKHVHGTSVGLVSVADNGRLQPVLWVSTLMPINAAMKFTVGPLYTQVGLGYAPGNETYSYELGLGAHLPLGRVFIEPGVHYSEMRFAKRALDHELLEHAHYRVSLGFDAGKVSPFIGVGILQRFAHSADAPSSAPVKVEGFSGVAFF